MAVEAREALEADGIATRVVSMPCVEWFNEQDSAYRESVLPPIVKARVSVEAGIAMPWHRFTGDLGENVSIEHFGASADYRHCSVSSGSPPRTWLPPRSAASGRPPRGRKRDDQRTAGRSRRGGRLHLARRPVPRAPAVRQPAVTDHRGQRRRRHHQPDDLRERAGQRRGLRPAGPRARRARRVGRRRGPRDHGRGRCAGLRRVPQHLGSHRRCRRAGVARGRPAAGPRHRRHVRRGRRPVEGRRPAQPAGQDPGHRGGPARDHRARWPRASA